MNKIDYVIPNKNDEFAQNFQMTEISLILDRLYGVNFERKTVANQGGNSGQPNLADFERGRRRKRKKVPPVKRFNFLVQKLDEFRRNNVVDNHKKTANKMSRFKNMLVNNLGVLKTPRTIRCMKIEESDKFIRQQKQAARK